MMIEPVETSLGALSDHDWNILSNTWASGIDSIVGKVGKRHWQILGRLGQGFPLFKTKTAAYDAATKLVLAESHHRAWRLLVYTAIARERNVAAILEYACASGEADDRLIENVYRQRCADMQIDLMRIPELFRMARGMLRQGETEQKLGDAMVAFMRRAQR